MKVLEENDTFKVNLIDDLNKLRLNGINCDIEIDSSISPSKIYTHSIILNLFSDTFQSFVNGKSKEAASISYHKFKFPDELDFLESDCFDCFKQVIDYFYVGELSIHPEHELHLKTIALNLKINRLIQILSNCPEDKDALFYKYQSPDQTMENERSQLCANTIKNQNATSGQLKDGHSTDDGMTEINMENNPCELISNINYAYEMRSDHTSKIKQSTNKELVNKKYEMTVNNLNTTGVERQNHPGEQIHSDGLHLLLSILEEENRKEFLIPDSNLLTSSKKCLRPYEFNNSHHSADVTQKVIFKTCETTNLEHNQAMVSNEDKEDDLDLNAHSENQYKRQMNTRDEKVEHEPNVKLKRRKIMKREENCPKRKKKENEEKVTGEQDGYMCKKCKMFFDNLSLFQEHLQSTHSKKFKCIACQFVTYKIQGFIDHLIQNRHEGTICSICHFQTSTNEELHKHIARHKQSLPKPFFCNDCDKTFPTRRSWSVHLPVHSHESQFLCAVCSKSFKWAQGLENHMSTHANEKLYLCDQCDFLTASRAYLAKHTLKHESKKEVCPYEECKHREIWKENFKAHLLTHRKEKRFQCELCGNSFAQARNLDRHLESVHNPYKSQHLVNCNQCNYFTIRLDKLKDHFKSRHKTYDYTQYMGRLREEMKIKAAQGVRVRHFISGAKPSAKSSNLMNQVENRVPNTVAKNQAVRTVINQKNVLALPVLKRDLVSSAEGKTQILMNVNKLGTPNIVGSLHTVSECNTVVNKVRILKKKDKSNKRESSQNKIGETSLKSSNSIANLKKILKPIQPKPQPSPFNSTIKPVLTNGPIFLIVSSSPRHQLTVKRNGPSENPNDKLLLDSNLRQNDKLVSKDVDNTTTDTVSERNSYYLASCETMGSAANYIDPQNVGCNDVCLSDNGTISQQVVDKRDNYNNEPTSSINNSDISTSVATPSFPKELVDGNYFDVLDESTGELHLLTSKHINNPFLDEATGELSVFEIPSSFVNYIEKLTSSEYEPDKFSDYDILDPESWKLQL